MIDFSTHSFSLSHHRDKILDYNNLIPQDHLLTILSQPKLYDSDDPFKILNVFTFEMWIMTLFMFICLGWINFLIQSLHSIKFEMQAALMNSIVKLMHSYIDIFTLFMGYSIKNWPYQRTALCPGLNNEVNNQKQLVKSSHQTLRSSLFIWVMCAFMLRQLLGADMLTALLYMHEDTIDTFDQLAWKTNNDVDFRILIVANSTSELLLKSVSIILK